jgi:3-deoxy-D-manno-octulosonic-acid transferase
LWICIYRLLWLLALPLVVARLLVRSVREPGYREDLAGRFGSGGQVDARGAVWMHAVSAGEVHAIAPLLVRLHDRDPCRPLLLTCSTASGRARARALLGGRVEVAWLPFDLPGSVERFLDRWRPALLALVETELWPVLIDRCAARRIPVVLVNGRLSERSARAYARLPALLRPMLGRLSCLLCQDRATAARFAALGADAAVLEVTGSLKFELQRAPDLDARAKALRRRIVGDASDAFVVVAGSTHAGEESALLSALLPLLAADAGWHLVLVPRHPRRCGAVERLCERLGHPALRASAAGPDGARLLLWDRMGDLVALYGAADAAFVGGSLVASGGHNPIEAAVHGTPVVVGPGAFDFDEVNGRLAEVGGLIVASDAEDVRAKLQRWRRRPDLRHRAGAAAQAAVRANRGALAATVAALEQCLQSSS